jgi:predicted metal-dependent hydrolase
MTAEGVAIRARDVEFDWEQAPLDWVPGDPFSQRAG